MLYTDVKANVNVPFLIIILLDNGKCVTLTFCCGHADDCSFSCWN